MKKILINIIFLLFSYNLSTDFPPAKQTYQTLNKQEPFVASMGIALCQTKVSANTIHPDFISKQLQMLMKKSNEPIAFLNNPERIWYILNQLKTINCQNCHKILSTKETHDNPQALQNLLKNIAHQKDAQTITITECPLCSSNKISIELKQIPEFTFAHQQALITQINFLNLKQQAGCQKGFPPYRISLEASEVMQPNSTELDPEKLQLQAAFLEQLGNPFTFFHHYTNPQEIPNLFEEDWHTQWFANYCIQVVQSCPNLKYFCPISQPIAYSFRLARQNNIPPFFSNLPAMDLFKNVIKAHIAAHDAIKTVNPQAEIFISHQYKPFVPLHNNSLDPRYYLEKFVCSIASKMYNDAFINELKKHENKFDGLALSVYPPVKFDLWNAIGDNCSGKIDEKHSLECIIKMHEAFPTKKIFIVETGCNHPDENVRKKFMDMTLSICLQAKQLGANVYGVYFWGQTNDSDFYLEWNNPRGSCNFGFFDQLNPQNPTDSVNAAGLYLKEIVQN